MGLSERRACTLVTADRKMIRCQSRRSPDVELRARLRDLPNERCRFGCRRLFILLRREGEPSGVNRIHRLYREEGLCVRKRRAWRKAIGTRTPILVEAKANARWSLDFVHDQFANGRRFRILNVVDEYTRECLAIRCERKLNSRDVLDTQGELFVRHGAPENIRSENGPEFIATSLREWLDWVGVTTLCIEPGSHWKNGYCESFNSKSPDELLATEIFFDLREAKRLIEAWRGHYKIARPHLSLGYKPPASKAILPAAFMPPYSAEAA